MRRTFLAAVGVGLNLVVLVAPLGLAGFGRSAVTDLAVLLFLVLASALCLGDLSAPAAMDAGRPSREQDPAVARLAGAEGLALLLVFWAAVTERALAGTNASSAASALAGALLMAGGVWLRVAAIHTLGSSFVTDITLGTSRQLVQRGVYRIVRHPSETGLLAVAAGACLLLTSTLGLVLLVGVLAPLSVTRTRWEDGFLETTFGAEYRTYAQSVGALVPRLQRSAPGERSSAGKLEDGA